MRNKRACAKADKSRGAMKSAVREQAASHGLARPHEAEPRHEMSNRSGNDVDLKSSDSSANHSRMITEPTPDPIDTEVLTYLLIFLFFAYRYRH